MIERCHLSALHGPEPPCPGGVLYQQGSKQSASPWPGPLQWGSRAKVGGKVGLEARGLKDSPGERHRSARGRRRLPGPQTEAPQVEAKPCAPFQAAPLSADPLPTSKGRTLLEQWPWLKKPSLTLSITIPTLLSSRLFCPDGQRAWETSSPAGVGSGISEQLRGHLRGCGWLEDHRRRQTRRQRLWRCQQSLPAPSPLRGAWNSGSGCFAFPSAKANRKRRKLPQRVTSRGRMRLPGQGRQTEATARLGRAGLLSHDGPPGPPHLATGTFLGTLAEEPMGASVSSATLGWSSGDQGSTYSLAI